MSNNHLLVPRPPSRSSHILCETSAPAWAGHYWYNFDMVQICSNRHGVKSAPRMWKTNPEATIEDLDGKSGPGATNTSNTSDTSDTSDTSQLGRCHGPDKPGMEDDPQPVMLRYEASLGRYPVTSTNRRFPKEFCASKKIQKRSCADLCRMLTSTSMCLPRW